MCSRCNYSPHLDEETGPAIIFGDGTETIFLADMYGDGLAEIVRVRQRRGVLLAKHGLGPSPTLAALSYTRRAPVAHSLPD